MSHQPNPRPFDRLVIELRRATAAREEAERKLKRSVTVLDLTRASSALRAAQAREALLWADARRRGADLAALKRALAGRR